MKKLSQATAVLLLGAFLLFGHGLARATVIQAYEFNDPVSGNHSFTGTIGLEFEVNEAIAILSFGAFDSSQDGLSRTITVMLWDHDDTSSAIASIAFATGNLATLSGLGYTLSGGYWFQDLSSALILDPGTYTITAHGYGSGEQIYNDNSDLLLTASRTKNDGGGLLTFTDSTWHANPGTFPNQSVASMSLVNVSDDFYTFGGPSFKYRAVPEPGTIALLGIGLLALGFLHRRRKVRVH